MIHGGVMTVFVSDMDRAVAFYAETLGLTLKGRWGDKWASLDAGDGLMIGLHPKSDNAPPPGTSGAISIGLNVTRPIAEVRAALQGKGVAFRGPVVEDAEGGILLAFFGDPDGNDLYLYEMKQTY